MQYEVELKYRAPDAAAIVAELLARGAQPGGEVTQRDTYFRHPVRDFGETDEAFRIRSVGEENRLTYKGPKIDRETKTREEIEVPFATGSERAAEIRTMLERLGFTVSRTVEKRRATFHLEAEGVAIEVAIDSVTGLGEFVELEAAADDETLDPVRATLLRFAEQLGLSEPDRRSYLELLLEQDA